MSEKPTVEIGVDIGGTFTDVVCHAPGGPLRIVKIPSTPSDPSQAVLQSIAYMAETWAIKPAQVARFVHGTTVATNAVLERKGARIGVLTTEGFRDVIEIGRQMRHQMYSVILEPETPIFLAPGARRREVRERVGPQGEVLIALDEPSVLAAVDALVARGVEAIAVSYLFSFLNPAHELRTRELIESNYPDIVTSLSCEVDPAFREYERTVATAFDAYLKPVIDRYLARLEDGLTEMGVEAPLQVMQSRGGISASVTARKRPVRLFLSGPAAGVIGGRMVGRASGSDDLITVDVGGTSCDIALVNRGKALIRAEGRIDGFPVRVPMVDVNTIGSGGGSIAWIDGAGGLRVGPHSAGAEPGPACYGRGGGEATVTDASIVLGYLDANYFAGGRLRLYPELAHEVVEKTVAKPLGMTVEEAALGIHRVVNAQMAEGIRLVSIRQGFDPRTFALLPLGGAGPVHGTALARELKITRIIIPLHPGVLSAAGLLVAQIEHEIATAFPRPLADLEMDEVRAVLASLDERCAALMRAEAIGGEDASISYYADVCYIGQSYHLEIPVRLNDPDPLQCLYREFLTNHDRVYGHSTEAPARIVNLRSIHQARGADALTSADSTPVGENAVKKGRKILLAGHGWVEAAVYDRSLMPEGTGVDGPAIIEQEDTTTLIEPDWRAAVVRGGNLLVTTQG